MMRHSWLRHSIQIARIERTRRRRQFGRSSAWRAGLAVVLVGLSIAGGVGAYKVGRSLSRGELTLPLGIIQAAATASAVILLTVYARRASVRFGRLNTDHLLTTVLDRDIVLGVALFVYSRLAIPISLPVLGIALGLGLGARSPVTALTVIVAVAGFLALVTLASVTLSLAGEYLAIRSPRFRRYRTIIVYGPLVLVWLAVTGPSIAIDRLVAWLRPVPLAWFADLALLDAPRVDSGVDRSVGAVCLLVGGLPVLTVVATALGERVWGADDVSSATIHRSRSIVGVGFAERVFAGHVSRPVLTVTRKRWVQERRVPRALMTIAALVLAIGSGVGVYALSPAGTPAVAPLLIAFACATGFGLGFGEYVLAAEYPSVPMTLTTVSGSDFIRGTILAGVGIGVPLTSLLTVAVGIVSPIGALELLLVTIVGVLLCGCSVTVATALGMRFAYTDFLLLPIELPLSSVRRVYGRMGKAPLLSASEAFGWVGLVSLPAFMSYLSVVSNPIATTLGITPVTVRIGALVVTMILAVAVSVPAYQQAVNRFNEYSLP